MAVKLSGILILISVICSFFTGRTDSLTAAAIEGSGRGVTVAFSLISLMCLWCGIMKVAQMLGALRLFSRLISPIIRLIMPETYSSKNGIEQVSASFGANLLGLGNGATPLALNAVKALPKGKNGRASNDLIAFTVLSCACPCLFPTTVITLRAAAGSVSPSSIIPLVWICSLTLFIFGAVLCRILGAVRK